MSDKNKKEIHVKDLVIKADNVIFEPPRRPEPPRHRERPPFDPFFGPRRREDEESSERREGDERDFDDEDYRRRPFPW
ncbi:hypothetical protein EDD68_10939 [Melghiribacillus thermohalophilus]|uniref:Uncharacterized protein n=1 Tax=Melghiribacillus thermohalophilus TaxID=1324956 RepID=A0A4R3N5H9_9BACI|nr:hypothetical protein [Melghiribacillus thermohalophilus]TCT22393.1 hypothetical protein EDD68_10939 [Melghiribacillus thermohalophilus]